MAATTVQPSFTADDLLLLAAALQEYERSCELGAELAAGRAPAARERYLARAAAAASLRERLGAPR